jgi:Family of unknown function (DUF6152)
MRATGWSKAVLSFALLAASTLAALPARAHHSFTAEFEGDKTITVQGVISKIDWINPHIYVYVDGKDQTGAVKTWSFETLPTGFLHKMGITKELLMGQPGDTVTVVANPAKDGTKELGWIVKITYPDGHDYILSTPANPNGNGLPGQNPNGNGPAAK